MGRPSFLFAGFAALACAACTPMTATKSTSLQAALTQYNMSLLRPPSNLYPPGAVARVQVLDAATTDSPGTIVSLGRLCPLPPMPLDSINHSPTNDLVVTYDLSADVTAKAELQKILQFNAGLNHVDKVELSLTNVTLYRPDDVQLAAAVAAIKQQGCSVSGRKQVIAVLQADASVKTTVSRGANLSVTQTQALQRLVGGQFGADFSVGSGEEMTGKGLFYGVEVAPPS